MVARKRDWDVITGWEKRIKVDYGSIGPNHVRWSDWTYKERDIVARKVHESAFISKEHGSHSKAMAEWAKENAPIMVGFARDHKPMPPWAHADYRESGVPEHVEVVWKRERPNDPASPGDWAYDPPHPWGLGEEPAWSARPKDPDYDGNMHAKYGGVISYRTAANGDHVASDGTVISTAESRAKQDVPQWKKFELGRLEDVDGYIIPGPNALPKDEEQYGKNREFTNIHKTRPQPKAKPDRIMPDDPNFTPMEKALSWAQETQHGVAHQDRWNEVAAALGADNGYTPMSYPEAIDMWDRFNRNARWSMAVEAIDDRFANARQAMDDGSNKGITDVIGKIETKPQKSEPIPQYRIPGTMIYGPKVPPPGSTGWYTRQEKWLPDWYWDLPEITDEEAKEQGVTSRAQVAPLNYIYHKQGVGILGRQKRAPEREDLPIWTKAEANAYYARKGIKMRSRQWLDGHLMQQPGYTDNGQGHGTFVARAASEEYEAEHTVCAVPNAMAEALKSGDWTRVADLADELAMGE